MALDINGYDNGMATSNNHVGNRSEYVTNNTAAYNQIDKSKGDDFLMVDEQIDIANRLNDAKGNPKKVWEIMQERNRLHKKNRDAAIKKRDACLQTTGRCTAAKVKHLNNLINNRPVRGEVIYVPEKKVAYRNRAGQRLIRTEPSYYEAKVVRDAGENLKNMATTAADVGLSLYPLTAMPYTVGKSVVGVVEDVQNGDFENTINNAEGFLIPKAVRGLAGTKAPVNGMPDAADIIGATSGVILNGDASE